MNRFGIIRAFDSTRNHPSWLGGLYVVLVGAACMVIAFCAYLRFTFPRASIDEVLFALNAPTGSLAFAHIEPVLTFGLTPLALLIILSLLAFRFLTGFRLLFYTIIICLSAFFFARYEAQSLNLPEYLESLKPQNKTIFIQTHYRAPTPQNVHFPGKKRNLVHIYLESVETTFADKTSGGAFNRNLIPELTELAKHGEDFRGSAEAPTGALALSGATWTMGAIFATESGLPLKISIDGNEMSTQNGFFPGVTALGDILKENGYKTAVIRGSDVTFAGARLYYRDHGWSDVLDYNYAANNHLIPKGYHVFWGFEDKRLFAIARKKLTDLAQGKDPFALTLVTADTHFPKGYVCESCPTDEADSYSKAFRCSSRQVADFVRWIEKQPFGVTTTVIIHGDHPTMATDFTQTVPASYSRRVFTTIINSPVHPSRNVERRYSTLDLFPTILASLGASIDGNRLGLGVNLYSEQETLVEQLGESALNHELSQGSIFMENLAQIDSNAGKTDLARFCIRNLDCFLESVKKVKGKDTLIVFAIQDEGTAALTESNLRHLNELGVTVDLRGKFRNAFIGAFTDKRLFEQVNPGSIHTSFSVGKTRLEIRSAGYGAGETSILINECERAKKRRGFNIVVYDLKLGRILASEAFDTYESRNRWR